MVQYDYLHDTLTYKSKYRPRRVRETELEEMLTRVNKVIKNSNKVRIDNGDLVVSPLESEGKTETRVALEERIDRMIPLVELTNLLIEVDNWTNFSQHFVHPSGHKPRNKEFLQHLFASIFAQGCNIDFTRMSLSASLSYDRLAWYNNWYVREETLRKATDELVNFHYQQPLSDYWGSGTLSSSDLLAFQLQERCVLQRHFLVISDMERE